MSWVYRLTDDAKKDLKALPRKVQERVARVLDQMSTAGSLSKVM